jgi:hypothetical protein
LGRFAEADHIEGYLTAEESETLATLLQKLEQGLEGADPHN